MEQQGKATLKKLVRGVALVAIIPLLMAGCSGSDGANGINGKNGTNGTDGTNGTNATLSGTHYLDANNKNLTVSNIQVTNASGTPQVTFNVAEDGVGGLAGIAINRLRFYMADLVPAGTPLPTDASTDTQSPYYEQWASETSSSGGTLKDNGGGNYTYTFTAQFGVATPNSGLYTNDYSATDPQRLILRVSGATEADGSVTNNTVGILDYMVPASGASATAADMQQYQKAYVTIDTCKKCHGAKMQNAAHASGYLDTRACVICHSPFYGSSRHTVGFMLEDYAVLDQMVHEIHGAIASPGLGVERGWDSITFPQDVKKCVICHADPANLTAGSAAAVDNWKNHPTAQACSSCHTTIVFGGASSFVGLDGNTKTHNPAADSDCSVCHTPTGGASTDSPPSVTVAHDPTAGTDYNVLNDVSVAQFIPTITITPPATGDFYVAGEAPVVTVTLTDASGDAVPSSVYTDATTDTVRGGDLASAQLYVYGPRDMAVPVLTPGSTTDATPDVPPNQGVSMLAVDASTDTNIINDANGFHYKLQAIPANMEPGTYMIGLQIEDDPASPYTAGLATFQIGTSTITPNVAGNGCYNCHGDTRMHDAPASSHGHNVPFMTDYCNMCHDRSMNHGDPISNRVHAVHTPNNLGDMANYTAGVLQDPLSRNYDTTFPRTQGDCSACHIYKVPAGDTTGEDGSTLYRSQLWGPPCFGCHATNGDMNPGATDHMAQNGFTFQSQSDYSTTDSCVVCHGPDRTADISDVKAP